jgi:hypothetical protein
MLRQHKLKTALVTVLLLAGCGGGTAASPGVAPTAGPTAAPTAAGGIWVAASASSMSNTVFSATTNPAGSERTYRFIVKPSVSSQGTIRLHFDNRYGTVPLTIGALHIGLAGSAIASIAAGSDRIVTFNGGATSVTIAAGAQQLSDQFAMTWTYPTNLAVSMYLSGTWPSLPQHSVSLVTSYETPIAAGNATADTTGAAFTATTGELYLFDRVDVYGAYRGTDAVVGSSTTLAVGADVDRFDDLVSDIVANLHAAGRDDTAVVNLAVAPDALLSINKGATNEVALVDRLATDVLTIPGIRAIVQNTGDVDLKAETCSNAAALIAGNQQITTQAHAAGVRLYLVQIAPTTFCNGQNPGGFGTRFAADTGQDAERVALNAWMYSTSPSIVDATTVQPPLADAVIDWATPVTDPTNTAYLLPIYDYGDNSHVKAPGQALQAANTPLSLL